MAARPKRTVLITGCSDGSLNSTLALAFHAAGWRVFATARNPAKLSAALATGIETLHLDTLSSSSSISAAVSRLSTILGPDAGLDALVNNAGAGYSIPLMDIDFDKAKEIYELNVWSPIAVTKAFLPLLRRSKHEYGALVVNNTSIVGQASATVPFAGVYNSSKAAATSLTEALRLELGVLGIKVVNLVTGSVNSGFQDNKTKPELPENSPYRKVKAEVEKSIAGEGVNNGMDRERWAEEVVRELGKRNPSYWVWKGGFSAAVRVANHLPVGLLDGAMKETFGLGVVERKVQELGGPRALLD